jgi:hypothetical protein
MLGNQSGNIENISAVSFADVNNDKQKDIVIITSYKEPDETNSRSKSSQADIYLQIKGGFAQDLGLSTYVNTGGEVNSCSSALKKAKNYIAYRQANKTITRDEASDMLSTWSKSAEGNNGDINAYPENDVIIKQVRYYYFEIVYADDTPAAGMFINSRNGKIYPADPDCKVILDEILVNHQD